MVGMSESALIHVEGLLLQETRRGWPIETLHEAYTHKQRQIMEFGYKDEDDVDLLYFLSAQAQTCTESAHPIREFPCTNVIKK